MVDLTGLSRVVVLGVVQSILVAGILANVAQPVSAGDFGWSSAVPLFTDTTGSADPSSVQIVFDPSGAAIAAWVERFANRTEVLASRSVWGGSWSAPTIIETVGDAFGLEVAMDDDGNGFAVWNSCSPFNANITCSEIHAARFSQVAGWGPPATVIANTTSVWRFVDLAVDGNGTAMILLWTDNESSFQGWSSQGWTSRSLPNNRWETPTLIPGVPSPRLAVNRDGSAVAVGTVSGDPGDPALYASRFNPGTGWRSPEVISPIDRDRGGARPSPQISTNAEGVSWVVWTEVEYGVADWGVWAVRFSPGTGWGTPARIGVGLGFRLHVEVDANGDAVAAWDGYVADASQPSGFARVLLTNRFIEGVGWGVEKRIGIVEDYFVTGSTWSVAGDPLGDVAVAYSDPGGNVSATWYLPGFGWGLPSRLGVGHAPNVFAEAHGNAIAAWGFQNATTYQSSIWTSSYISTHIVSNPLPLEILSPTVVLTNNPNVIVSGVTRAGAGIAIDRTHVPVDRAGAFTYTTTLPEGPHTFLIVAYDAFGGTNSRSLSVVVDTRAPALTLGIPASGVTTSEASVLVSGVTEPGATVALNGLAVAVGPDGSFAIRLGLVEGTNTIVATATDTAGNVATETVTATYVNLLGHDLALSRGVALAGLVGVIGLAVVLALFNLPRPKRGSRSPGESHDGPRLDDTSVAASETLNHRGRANGAVLLRDLSAERRWPAKGNPGWVRLTAKERILLHLLHYARYAEAPEVPPELTQGRIVEAAGIDRRHFAQYVQPLIRDGLVRVRTARVRSVVQRRRVYVLTEEGRSRALEVRDRVRSAVVRVRDASGLRDVTVAEVLLEAKGSMSVLDILRESIETGVVEFTR